MKERHLINSFATKLGLSIYCACAATDKDRVYNYCTEMYTIISMKLASDPSTVTEGEKIWHDTFGKQLDAGQKYTPSMILNMPISADMKKAVANLQALNEFEEKRKQGALFGIMIDMPENATFKVDITTKGNAVLVYEGQEPHFLTIKEIPQDVLKDVETVVVTDEEKAWYESNQKRLSDLRDRLAQK